MPRISIRKLFVYLLAIASCVLLALNIQQRATGLFTSSLTPTGPSGPPPPSAPALDPKDQGPPKKALDGKLISKEKTFGSTFLPLTNSFEFLQILGIYSQKESPRI